MLLHKQLITQLIMLRLKTNKMKKTITTFLAVGLGIMTLNAQNILSSNFSDWANGVPTDWMGARSSIHADSVSQITGSSIYGTDAAELRNGGTSHKRFTSQTVSVTSGEAYTVEIWIKGTGDIRTGLYDGSVASAYSYNSYINADDSDWTMYSQTITADTTTSEAEVILSVVNTSLTSPLVIDSISVYVEGLETTSVYDIQYTTDINGDSPVNGNVVMTSGYVSAVSNAGYYLQDLNATGAYSGVFVYDGNNVPAIGDELNLTATVTEYYGLTELTNVAAYEVVSSDNNVMPYEVSIADVNTEAYEGVLISIAGSCTNTDLGFGMWELSEGANSANIDDFIYAYTPDLGANYVVTGVVDYSFEEYKVLPRDVNDIDIAFSVEENNVPSFNIANNNLILDEMVSSIDIYNLIGERVMEFNNVYMVNFSSLNQGTYIVQMNNNGVTYSFKLNR